MEQFCLVCHLLEQYINLTRTNHLITAILAIKDYASKTKPQNFRRLATSQNTNKRMLDSRRKVGGKSEWRSRNDENSYKTERIKTLKEIEEDEDEFEDTILEKLQTIQENIKRLKKRKEQKGYPQNSQQKTLTLIEELPKFRKRYFECQKQYKQQQSTASKNQHFENSFQSCFTSSSQSVEDQQQFSFSQVSYKPPISNSSKEKTLKEESSRKHLQRTNKFTFPIYLMPAELICSCEIQGHLKKRFGKRRPRISFDGCNRSEVKKGKRIKVKSKEKE